MTAASLLNPPEESPVFLDLLTPEPLADGREPETRFVCCGLSWKRYLAFDEALSENRPGPRFYYLDGELEIMGTSEEHERIKKLIAGLLELYFDEQSAEITPRGQSTMRLALEQAGAEPDESWCLGEEKQFPDLVLEIALTSGGVRKLELYRRFEVPEVWFWRKGQLEVFALRKDAGGYDAVIPTASRLMPGLDINLLERCVKIGSWKEARRTFRAGLAG